jgi:hypothetical protein
MRRPVAQPVGSEASGRKARPGAASPRFSPPKDLVSARSSYITPERVFLVSRELVERDRQILNFLSECRLASGKQLVRQFWHTSDREASAARAGRRALKRLSDWRVLDPMPRRVGSRRSGSDGLVYGVGRLGARLLAQRGYTGPRIEAPGALYVAHTLACTELVVALNEADRDGVLALVDGPPASGRTGDHPRLSAGRPSHSLRSGGQP